MGSQVPVSPQQKDFDRFETLGKTMYQAALLQRAVIQNAGHNPTSPAEISGWALAAERDLDAVVYQMRQHIRHVQHNLLDGTYGKGPLGYYKDGTPIYPLGSGMIATACIISCSTCSTIIRGNGGPAHGAKCPTCYPKD